MLARNEFRIIFRTYLFRYRSIPFWSYRVRLFRRSVGQDLFAIRRPNIRRKWNRRTPSPDSVYHLAALSNWECRLTHTHTHTNVCRIKYELSVWIITKWKLKTSVERTIHSSWTLTRPRTSVELDSHAHLSGVVTERQESNFRRPNRRIQFLFVFQVRVDVTDQYL